MTFYSKGKLFGKINVIDLLVVLVIIAAIAGVSVKYMQSKANVGVDSSKTIEISFYQEDAPSFAASAVKKGDTVKDAMQNNILGKVSDVRVDKSVFFGVDNNGRYVASPREGYNSITITSEVKGIIKPGGGTTINNYEYFIGKQIEVRAGSAVFWARISDVKIKE